VAETISMEVAEVAIEPPFHASWQRALKLLWKAETPSLPPLSRVGSERRCKPCL